MKLQHSILALTLAPILTVSVAACDQGSEPDPQARSGDAPTPEPAPQVQAELSQLEPVRTRNGSLRFISPQLHEVGAFAVVVERFETGGESPEVRAALVEAMARTPDYDPGVLADALLSEPSPIVRAAMATAFADGGAGAHGGLEHALADDDAAVVAAAVSAWGRRSDADNLEATVIERLGSDDSQVVIASAGALALRGADAAKVPLASALGDERADVRFAAIKALARIDADYTASLPAVLALTGDSDARVARRARGLLDR